MHACPVSELCPILSDSMDSPVRILWPWDFLGENAGVGCHFLSQKCS